MLDLCLKEEEEGLCGPLLDSYVYGVCRKLFNDLTGDQQQSYVVRKVEEDSSDGHMTQGSNDNSNDTTSAIGNTHV